MFSLSKFNNSKKRPLSNFSVNPKRNSRLKNRNRNNNNNNNNLRFKKTARIYNIPNISKELNEFDHTSVTTNNHTIFLVLNVHGVISKNLNYNKSTNIIQVFEPDEEEGIDFVSQIIYGKYLCPNYYINIDRDFLKKELFKYCLDKADDKYLDYATNKMTSFEFMELCKNMFATKYMMEKGFYKIEQNKYNYKKMFPTKHNNLLNTTTENIKEFLSNHEKYPYYDRIFKDIFDNFIINTYNPDPELTLLDEGNNFLVNKKYKVNLKIYHKGKK